MKGSAMRYFKILLLVLVAAALAVPAALAGGSPHFIGTPTCSTSNSGVLTCSGKAAGLANGPVNAYLTADSVNATYVCRNHGGNVAPGQGTFSGPVQGQTQQIAPRNGQITFSPSLQPPSTPTSSEAGCPNGKWTVDRTSLTYVNVVLHIDQGGVTDVLTYSFGNITA
jgi:hypothetical protein